jgi:hypothetical protein
MFETVPSRVDLVVGQGVEHEGVIRVRAVPHADQLLVGSDCGHEIDFGF